MYATHLLKRLDPTCTLTCVSSGTEAVQQGSGGQFDIIFMDVKMPGMGGIEATANILHANPRQVIIGMTGYDDRVVLDECLAAGMVKTINKPFREPDFKTILEEFPPQSAQQDAGKNQVFANNQVAANHHAPPNLPPAEFDHSLLDEVGPLKEVLLTSWQKSMTGWLGALEQASDRAEILDLLHTIAGASAQVGAVSVCEMARTLEDNPVKSDCGKLALIYDATLALLNQN
jgi:CheY-like chemotaxis protein